MFETATIVAIVATFLIAGTVKGLIGLGLPTVSLALLAVAIDLTSAMALVLVPSFVTNLWQALAGGHLKAALRRTWPFLAVATLTVWLGALALIRVDLALLSALLGALLAVYSALGLAGLRPALTAHQAAWLGPLAGLANGVFTGMTGSSVVPGVLYLQAIGLERDILIQAMGLLFAGSTLALGVAMRGSGLLTPEAGRLVRHRPGAGHPRHGAGPAGPARPAGRALPADLLRRAAGPGRLHRRPFLRRALTGDAAPFSPRCRTNLLVPEGPDDFIGRAPGEPYPAAVDGAPRPRDRARPCTFVTISCRTRPC